MVTKPNPRHIARWSAQHKQPLAIAVLTIFYLVGIAGILIPIHPAFIRLTPFNLLLSAGILMAFQPAPNTRTKQLVIICFITGFLAEVIGVKTGLLFGNYTYGEVLGFKIWDTPLLIGINWILVTFSAASFIQWLLPRGTAVSLRVVLAALAMVGLDLLIEPDAIQYQMWTWNEGVIPLRNYLGWFVVALPLQVLYHYWATTSLNLVAAALFILQILFFIAI
ncbi:MAG: carotenoid biosynthesis protein [Haliscomenobacter sp.]